MRSKAQHIGQLGLKSLLSAFLQKGCPVCDRPSAQTFCIDCQRQIEAEFHPSGDWHLQRDGKANRTDRCHSSVPVHALGHYQGTLKQAIRALKYSNRPAVAQVLGKALAERWLTLSSNPSIPLQVIPIPLHPNRLKQRGYNQAALIASAFCQVSRLPLHAHGLYRQHDTVPQHQLGLDARQQNVAEAFTVSAALQRRRRHVKAAPNTLLIDDIYTTGATAQSAAIALEKEGFPVVGMLALAQAVSD